MSERNGLKSDRAHHDFKLIICALRNLKLRTELDLRSFLNKLSYRFFTFLEVEGPQNGGREEWEWV
jgi:hypothetical protein